MRRINILVEGVSEQEFVRRILAPWFLKEQILVLGIPLRKGGGGKGFSNFEHFKNNVKPLLHEKDEPIISTFVDLYRFPVQSGDPTEEQALKACSALPTAEAKIEGFEQLLTDAVEKIKPTANFVPYVQMHEFEALIFSNAAVLDIEDERIAQKMMEVSAAIEPEEINTTENGHPAKRLELIFEQYKRKYNKGADAVDYLELIGIEVIMEKCPRFRNWLERLLAKAKENTNPK